MWIVDTPPGGLYFPGRSKTKTKNMEFENVPFIN